MSVMVFYIYILMRNIYVSNGIYIYILMRNINVSNGIYIYFNEKHLCQ